MEGSQGTSYGGRFSGGDFDLIEFLKRPLTICRLLCILFAILVFGCISAGGHVRDTCVFNRNQDACQYGTAIGVIAFIQCLLFLLIDANFDSLSNTEWRRYIVLFDLLFSGIWTFLWFVSFCFLADQWRKADIYDPYESNHARAAITFSFFSIFSWIPVTYLAYKRYSEGSGLSNDFNQPNDYNSGYQAPTNDSKQYASFPRHSEGDDFSKNTYQSQPFAQPQPPFGIPPQSPVKTDYDVPNY